MKNLKKLWPVLLSAILLFALAACGGGDAPADPSDPGTTDPGTSQQEPSGGAQTPDDKDTAAFAQFGINIESVKADIEGEISTFTTVKDPLSYGAHAKWSVKPAVEATVEQQAAYCEQVYNAIKAISDDSEVHGSWTNEDFESVFSLDEAKDEWVWGYLYNGCYVDAYCQASSSELAIELVYAGQKK